MHQDIELFVKDIQAILHLNDEQQQSSDVYQKVL
jgi:hypothetical protein